MKNLTLILILSMFSSDVFSQISNNSFEIKGVTSSYNSNASARKLNNVTIKVYQNNDLINTLASDEKSKFNLKIPKNAYITLVFEKDNFVTKRILFDTRASKENKNDNVRPFDLEIVLLERMEGIDYSDLDFPITIIQYVKKMNDYYYATKYTEKMLKVQQEILMKMEEQILTQK